MNIYTKKQQGFSIVEIALVLVTICLLGFIVFYFVSNTNKKSATKENTQVAGAAGGAVVAKDSVPVLQNSGPIILASAKFNPPAGWQIYKEPFFSFQYPADWTYHQQGDIVDQTESIENQLVPSGEKLNGSAEFAFTVDNSDLSALDYLKSHPPTTGEATNQKDLAANGYTAATEIEHGGGAEGGANQDTIRGAVTHNGLVVTFFYPANSKYISTYNQIFKTVKFNN